MITDVAATLERAPRLPREENPGEGRDPFCRLLRRPEWGPGLRRDPNCLVFYRPGRLRPVLGDTDSPTNWFVPCRFNSSRMLPLAAASLSRSAASCGVFTACWSTETMTSPG